MHNQKLLILCLFLFLVSQTHAQTYDSLKTSIKTDKFSLYQFNQGNSIKVSENETNVKLSILYPAKPRKNVSLSETFIFFGLLLMLTIVLLIKIFNPGFLFSLFVNAFNSDSLMEDYLKRDSKSFLLINNLLLDFVFILSLSFFVFKIISVESGIKFWQITMIITLIYLLQILIVRFFYRIFFPKSAINIHHTQILIYNRMAGIIILPLLLVIYFGTEPLNILVIKMLTLLLTIMIIYRILRNIILIKKINSSDLFYVLLYLCVFEISLYFVILKEFFGLNHN